MRIVPYDRIEDPTQFAVLMGSAFGWPAPPDRIAAKRRADPRYRDPYGFGLFEGRTLAGFVGVLEVWARLRSGAVAACGGIHHVMTRPGCERKGVARRLMEYCHDRFRARGYPVSFLFTSRVLVAVGLYEKLGYQSLPLAGRPAPTAYLVRDLQGRPPKPKRRRPDYSLVERLFACHGQNSTSFVRDPGWLQARMKGWEDPADRLLVERGGYAYVEADKSCAGVRELVARDAAARLRLVRRVERLNRPVTVWYVVNDPALRRILRRRGCYLRPRGFGRFMAKTLTVAPLSGLIGPHFTYSPLDQF
jgi:GNAT superfamily N-acetyltransferase